MRLCTLRPHVRRTWTVELRPQRGGPMLYCPLCTSDGHALLAPAAQPAVLAHLAQHARHEPLPAHLRTCQCHERGCRWHPRHRGCAGPVLLVLTRERGGRLWRLSDICTACASATPGSAVVPDVSPTPPSAKPATSPPKARRARVPRGARPELRVRDMLSYLAAALPWPVSAEARLIALQCALRASAPGLAVIHAGLLRAMRLAHSPAPWNELEQARWLCLLPDHLSLQRPGGVAVRLLDAAVHYQEPARRDRLHAAGWAMRVVTQPELRALPAEARLTALTLTAHHYSGTGWCTSVETDRLLRTCALDRSRLAAALDLLVAVKAIATWTVDPTTEDLHWEPPPGSAFPAHEVS
ncbi:hypothetical protein SAMN05444921_13613 [Streptomyces wuyuanensis]|uniref:Uncharacterized protein n=2 Tax=Streptomyces wuyuanensis TaxID=1196353 RepID=A0A1H0DSW0_9ACTN|nr:hypothetical protein SAMN05444921_13613 [Streptomyces wuyuanensis]